MNDSFIRFAGWSALANAALNIAIFVTLMLLFVVSTFWGRVNDAISVVWALSFVPLLIVFYQINRPVNAPLSLATMIAGIVAMAAFAFLQSLLVLSVVRFEQTFLAVVTLGAVLGLAMLLNGLLTRGGAGLPVGLAWLMIAFGLGYILSAAGIWLGGQQHPLAATGYLTSIITGLAWTIWLGRLLLSNRMPVSANFTI